MARLVIDLDSSEFARVREVLAQRLGDARPLLRNIGMQMMRSVDLQFRSEGRRFGAAWKRSRRAIEQDGMTLQDTGRLRASVVSQGQSEGSIYRLTESTLEIGSNQVYANIHQFGGVIRRKTRRARVAERILAHGRVSPRRAEVLQKQARERGAVITVMPARPYLPAQLTPEDRNIIEREIAHYLTRGLGG